MTVKCHEFLGCKEFTCPMFKENETRKCWEAPADMTLCMARTAANVSQEKQGLTGKSTQDICLVEYMMIFSMLRIFCILTKAVHEYGNYILRL